MTDPHEVARNRTEVFARRIRAAATAIGHGDPVAITNWTLNLASHAALAVALDARLINLMRVNFFIDEERLPYWTEAPVLLWGLCRDEGNGLYVMDGATRDFLLQRLAGEYQPERARKIATLLWQYAEREPSWADRRELRHAQQLTAMSFIDREKAQEWLDLARHKAGEETLSGDWFVAMREELPVLPVLAREAGDPEAVSQALMFLATELLGRLPQDLVAEVQKRSLKISEIAVSGRPEDAVQWFVYWSLRVLQISSMFEVTLSARMNEDLNEFSRALSEAAGSGRDRDPRIRLAEEARAGRRVAFVLNGAESIRAAVLRNVEEILFTPFRSSPELPFIVTIYNRAAPEFTEKGDLPTIFPSPIQQSAIQKWLDREQDLLKVPDSGLAESITQATSGAPLRVLEHLCRACGVRWKDVLARTRAPLVAAPIKGDPIRAIAAAYTNAANAKGGNQTLPTVWAAMSSKLAAALRAWPDWPVGLYADSNLEGERLVAMLALQISPAAEWIRWLAERVQQEQPFAALQALIALERASERLQDSELPAVAKALARVRRKLIDQRLSTQSNRYRTLNRAEHVLEQRRLGKEDVLPFVQLANTVVLPGTTLEIDASDTNALRILLQTLPAGHEVFALFVPDTLGHDAGSRIGTVISVSPARNQFRATGLRRARIIDSVPDTQTFVRISPEPDASHAVPPGFRGLLLDLNEILFEDEGDGWRLNRESDLALLCYWVASLLHATPSALQALLEEPSMPTKLEQVYALLRQAIATLDPLKLSAGERRVVYRALTSSDDEQLQLTASRFAKRTVSSRKRRNADYQQLRLWPNGTTLRIKFLSGSRNRHEQVMKIARQWISAANLHFEVVPRNSKTRGDIRIAFDANAGNWSYVGADARSIAPGEPTMNLGILEPKLLEAAVLKEFGHALGLLNEHQNPNARIAWNAAAVLKEMTGPPNFWAEAEVRSNILVRASSSFAYREFDPASVMMYPVPAHWTTNNQAYAPSPKLTASDRRFIAELYPRAQRPELQATRKKK